MLEIHFKLDILVGREGTTRRVRSKDQDQDLSRPSADPGPAKMILPKIWFWSSSDETDVKPQEKFPSVVSLPGGCRSEVMSLKHPELPGCVIFVLWSVEVSSEGSVAPNLQLLPKIPEEALQMFPLQPAGGASKAFQSLLRVLGPEAAIEAVIRATGLLPEPSVQTEG